MRSKTPWKNPRNPLCVMRQNYFIGYCERLNITQAYRDACFIHKAHVPSSFILNSKYDKEQYHIGCVEQGDSDLVLFFHKRQNAPRIVDHKEEFLANVFLALRHIHTLAQKRSKKLFCEHLAQLFMGLKICNFQIQFVENLAIFAEFCSLFSVFSVIFLNKIGSVWIEKIS